MKTIGLETRGLEKEPSRWTTEECTSPADSEYVVHTRLGRFPLPCQGGDGG